MRTARWYFICAACAPTQADAVDIAKATPWNKRPGPPPAPLDDGLGLDQDCRKQVPGKTGQPGGG